MGPGPMQRTKLKRQMVATTHQPRMVSPVLSKRIMKAVTAMLATARKVKVTSSRGRRPYLSTKRELTRTPTAVMAQTATLARAAPKVERPTDNSSSKAYAFMARKDCTKVKS